jgi:glycosyltransferase involved in cell wall biosynthesis
MSTERRRVLMVAFHFPPMAGSSGIQRSLRFVQHLPRHGWDPIVLSAHPRVYDRTASDLLAEVPANVPVHRAFALDTARHLSFGGRYPGALARPDRWSSWRLGAVPAGLSLIRRYRPDVIWSTYPIATAHRIALTLHKLSAIPLVMDFRDPMAQEGYPADPRTWRSFEQIEHEAVRYAAKLVFVTPGCQRLYRERYSHVDAERFALIENGFDEEAFVDAERDRTSDALNPGRLTILHSGIVYPAERDPSALFGALGRMLRAGRIDTATLRIRFRAPLHSDLLERLAAQSGTSSLIEILPAVPYREALREMMRSDSLLVMQGANCNDQIPAKLYEYFRAGRPILGLADPTGDTGICMLRAGVRQVVPLEDTMRVEDALDQHILDLRSNTFAASPSDRIETMSRRARTQALADLLASVSKVGRKR